MRRSTILARRFACFVLWHQWGDVPALFRSPYAMEGIPVEYEHQCQRCGRTDIRYHPV